MQSIATLSGTQLLPTPCGRHQGSNFSILPNPASTISTCELQAWRAPHLHDHDFGGVHDCRQAVGNNDACAMDIFQRLLYFLLRQTVQGARGLLHTHPCFPTGPANGSMSCNSRTISLGILLCEC